MNFKQKISDLYKDKKVLILGLGINQGGLGAARFFAEAGANLRVTDLKSASDLQPSIEALNQYPNIDFVLGTHRYEDLDWADLIIRNPALKPENPYLKYAKEKDKRVEMDMGIFLQFVDKDKIIGVTGAKGKSTTSSMIYEVLSKAGKKIVFGGNIGKSVLDTIPFLDKETLVVLEISSFQLEAFEQHKVSPKRAVITNIYPDHLNYYGSMENYIKAKKIIAKYQTKEDFLFLRQNDEVTSQPDFLDGLDGNIINFSASDLPENFSPQLPGEHNLDNIAAALAVTSSIGINKEFSLEILKNSKGVEFRLQLIQNKEGIRIYNDSAATNPIASIQALRSLPNSILIAGGTNKELDYGELGKAISEYAKAVFFLEGDATDQIKKSLPSKYNKVIGTYNDLGELLKDVRTIAHPGDIILFSPGAASFNLFQNEFDRGRKFNEYISKIFA